MSIHICMWECTHTYLLCVSIYLFIYLPIYLCTFCWHPKPILKLSNHLLGNQTLSIQIVMLGHFTLTSHMSEKVDFQVPGFQAKKNIKIRVKETFAERNILFSNIQAIGLGCLLKIVTLTIKHYYYWSVCDSNIWVLIYTLIQHLFEKPVCIFHPFY